MSKTIFIIPRAVHLILKVKYHTILLSLTILLLAKPEFDLIEQNTCFHGVEPRSLIVHIIARSKLATVMVVSYIFVSKSYLGNIFVCMIEHRDKMGLTRNMFHFIIPAVDNIRSATTWHLNYYSIPNSIDKTKSQKFVETLYSMYLCSKAKSCQESEIGLVLF